MTERTARPIVVAVPHDDDLEAAIHYAASEARIHHCGIRLVHAHASGDEGHAELVLGRASAVARLLAGPSVRISTRRVVGEPVAAVLGSSRDARLVVLRRRDSLHLLRVLTSGSPGADSGVAIACVPTDWAPRMRDPRPVLVPIGDPADTAMIRQSLEIAREHRTALRILHAWHLPGRYDKLFGTQISPELGHSLRTSLRDALERARCGDDFADVPVDLEVYHGIAAELVVQEGRHAQALLLEHNPPGPDGGVHLGRTTRAALHQSPCPVVLVTPPRVSAAGARPVRDSSRPVAAVHAGSDPDSRTADGRSSALTATMTTAEPVTRYG